ncbi:Uncharacterized protein APZ42_018269 [Daphnia magna]|uniref:SF3 helicase domain-containing protein n=1 Tax=Daphnia magna TaxID=35525 RepID=A0A164Z870_9CRUS|nr:Uncharacterized protein APZ42_018269 [Daphnia magna]
MLFRNARNLVFKHKHPEENVQNDEWSEIFTVGTKYAFSENTEEEIQTLLSFMSSILPDEDILNFFFDILAESTFGRNTHNKIILMLGKCANGKSTMTSVLAYAFGDLFEAFGHSAAVKKQLIEITDNHCVRLIGMADTPTLNFNHSLLKQLSGLDSIPVKELHPTATIRTCEAMIIFGGSTVMHVYDSMSEETRRNVRKREEITEAQMRAMGKTLMVFLCKRQADRMREAKAKSQERTRKLEIPQSLKKFQEECILKTHDFLEFVRSNFERSFSENDIIETSTIREMYLSRFKKTKTFSLETVENMLESVFEKVTKQERNYVKLKIIQRESNDV